MFSSGRFQLHGRQLLGGALHCNASFSTGTCLCCCVVPRKIPNSDIPRFQSDPIPLHPYPNIGLIRCHFRVWEEGKIINKASLMGSCLQTKKKGWIGLNVYAFGCNPLTNSTADAIATQRSLDFLIGWVVNPLMFGDYPDIMKKRVGSRIPSFTRTEAQLVKGSFDFIGLNHYFTINIKDDSTDPGTGSPDFNKDMGVMFSASSSSGLLKLLEYFKNYYGNPPVYIQENGYGGPRNESLNDTARIDYLSGFMESMLTAIRNGSNAKGYFVWSFLDVFELLGGYMTRYGLVHVDFDDKELKRQLKLSAQWYSNFLKGRKSMNIKSTRDTSHSFSH